MSAPTFNTIYGHYSDEVARLANSITIENDTSPSLSGGDDYGPDTLVDDNPAKVAKINESDSGSPAVGLVSGAWVLAYSAKQPIAVAGLIHHSFDETEDAPGSPAPSVRIEGNATDDFTSPAFSAAFTIPPWLGSGTGRWPQNAGMNLTEQAGYDPEGFLFWRLVIENNSQNIQLGQLVLYDTLRQFDPDLRWGLRDTPDKPQIDNRTGFGVKTIYPRATTLWAREADILLTDDMRSALEAHWYDVEGGARPFLLILAGHDGQPRTYFVRYTMTAQQVQWNSFESHAQHLSFEEVGRGLRPGE